MKLLVAIPAFNEAQSIGQVIKEVKESLPDATILVVDDGSTDQTNLVAKSCEVKVIKMPFNVGVGGVLKVAFKYALENNYSGVLQIDADGQHIPSEAHKLIQNFQEDSLIIGTRFLNKNSNYEVELTRKFAINFLARVLTIISKTQLSDVTSGFRLSTGKVIELFAKEYPRDYLGDTVESIVIASRAGFSISEIPVLMKNRLFGKPSQNFLRSCWYLFRILLVIFISLLKPVSKYR